MYPCLIFITVIGCPKTNVVSISTSCSCVENISHLNGYIKIFMLLRKCVKLHLNIITVSVHRGQKLDESLTYQQFVANVEEEEAWISEKSQLMSSEDYGDTMAAVQVR